MVAKRVAVAVPLLMGLLSWAGVAAGDEAANKQEEQAIRTAAKEYEAAVAKGDAKKAAEYWTADGSYVDEDGRAYTGQGVEVGQAAESTSGTSSKIRFLTADVAIEDGTSAAPGDEPGESPTRGQYHAVWVKQSGRWRLAALYEQPIATAPEAHLREFDWMVGTWIGNAGGARWEVTVRWNATGTYLLRDTKAIENGKSIVIGSQRIGWDPLTNQLKSWSFDADGGHSEATWSKQGDSWVGQSTGVLADGRVTSATTVINRDGKDGYTRKTVAALVQGEPKPDQTVRFTRQHTQQ